MARWIAIVFCITLAVRLFGLTERPLQFDEGVNYSFVRTIESGHAITYDPANYHGPLFFYLLSSGARLFAKSCDDTSAHSCRLTTEFGMRISSAVTGALLSITPFLLTGFISTSLIVLLSLALIASPSLIFQSQVAIHEISFVLFALSMTISLFRWHREEKNAWLIAGSFFLGLLMATKETGICIVAATLLAVLLHGAILKRTPRVTFSATLLALFVLTMPLLLFIPGHGVTEGVTAFINGIFAWKQRGAVDVSQYQPWSYFVLLLLRVETLTGVLAATIPVGLYLLRKRIDEVEISFSLYLYIIGAVLFAIFSSIPYKTPWLIIDFSPFFLMSGGTLLFQLLRAKRALFIFVSAALLIQHHGTYREEIYPLQPVPSYQGVRDLGEDLISRASKQQNGKVLVAFNDAWPLPFYLQPVYDRVSYTTGAPDISVAKQFDAIVLDFRESLPEPFLKGKEYTIHGRRKVRAWHLP